MKGLAAEDARHLWGFAVWWLLSSIGLTLILWATGCFG